MRQTHETELKELCQYIVDVLLLKIKNMTFRDVFCIFSGPGKWEHPYTLTVYQR